MNIHFIDNLNRYISDVDFYYAFPNQEFTVPLTDRFRCAVSVTAEKDFQSDNTTYQLDLIAPLHFSGKTLFDKADEICNFLLHTEKNVHCRIEDITYDKWKKCYSIKITATFSSVYFQNCHIACSSDTTIDGIITSVKVKYQSCDILVYGMSKPFDTILENCVYTLEIQTTSPLSTVNNLSISYDTSEETICYRKGKVNHYSVKANNNANIYCYEITAYERNVATL